MVNLVIMRHGEAEPLSSQDSQRQLTPKGAAEVRQMAHWLAEHQPCFDQILCSPYQRTRQTAEIMLAHQDVHTQFEILPELIPEGNCQQLQLYVDAVLSIEPASRVLLVSHMPLVSFLVETFTRAGCTPIFETAAMMCIEYYPGQTGKLVQRISPSDLCIKTDESS